MTCHGPDLMRGNVTGIKGIIIIVIIITIWFQSDIYHLKEVVCLVALLEEIDSLLCIVECLFIAKLNSHICFLLDPIKYLAVTRFLSSTTSKPFIYWIKVLGYDALSF